MDQRLIYILVVLLAIAAALFYVYVVKGRDDPYADKRSTLFGILVIFVPIIGMILWQQGEAKHRLEELGIAVHPQLGPSIGAATGGSMSKGTWLFEFFESEATLLDFYREPQNRSGWSVAEDVGSSLIIENDQWRLVITRGDDSAIFFVMASK